MEVESRAAAVYWVPRESARVEMESITLGLSETCHLHGLDTIQFREGIVRYCSYLVVVQTPVCNMCMCMCVDSTTDQAAHVPLIHSQVVERWQEVERTSLQTSNEVATQ